MSKTKTYNHNQIEPKWQEYWEKQKLFLDTAKNDFKNKIYLLFAFAYPSGSGLHVGHVESKTALDILARFYRMNNKDVFFPVGWDAFGLPAENYAVKTGTHPKITTKKAIDTFKRQIKRVGISYDWANEIATMHEGYYQWTQWIFLELFKKGLAYQKKAKVNWCPSCQTVLANEQVIDGHCERCDAEVEQKMMKQWFFKITDYQDELISGLDQVDWPEQTKQQQLNWIGRSEGAEIRFKIQDSGNKILDQELLIYTTAHDTIYGCTFMVVAPEHEFLIKNKKLIKNWDQVEKYIKAAGKKTELDRQVQKDKTGVKIEGLVCINPANGQEIPIFVADYVLAGYGTGAIMAVPGHDERDYEFSQKFDLDVIFVTDGANEFVSFSEIKNDQAAFILKNSQEFDGLNFKQGREEMLEKFVSQGFAQKKTEYKLRDWLISRQRYWGAPIPIVYDPDGKAHPVKAEHLPWKLPTDVDFKPTGESPLKSSQEFIKRVEKLYGKGWRPEFDTMDTFVCSSWYYLRYADSRNQEQFASPEKIKKLLPVDFYMIGPEHIVLHLLCSRFFTKFLRDQGYLNFDEPFMKMRHQGMILGPDGKKMSKSKGNVINPDEVIEKFGADTLRVYEMFMGPIEADKPWDENGVMGVNRFLKKIYKLSVRTGRDLSVHDNRRNNQLTRKLHQTIKKVTEDIPDLKFNTAIAMMMEFVNLWSQNAGALHATPLQNFIKILAPFAPFLAEELWSQINGDGKSVHLAPWPKYDPDLAQDSQIIIPVQINGKVRDQLIITVGAENILPPRDQITTQAKGLPKIQKYLANQKIKQEIYVPGKIINFVV